MTHRLALCLLGIVLAGATPAFAQKKPQNQKNNITMKPFKIDVAQGVLDDLQNRLKQTRWTDEPQQPGWDYGTDPQYLRSLVSYWQTHYDWRKQEALLNQFPQFTAEIDGINIHFLHIKGKGPNAKPLILTHGWPDSFYRYYKVIALLTDPASHGGRADQSFDVVIPSIPGFGFSSHVPLPTDQTADLWLKLMKDVLGYPTFYAAGGDMGAMVTKALAIKHPAAVRSIHLTDVGYPDGTEDWSKMTPAEQEFGQTIQRWFFAEGAFNMIQSTKPQTLGYALNDSPVGLASWIIEKFYAWSDGKGNIERRFTKDELLTNIMIYWVTQTINPSIRTYAEMARAAYGPTGPVPAKRVEVPTAVAVFPAEAQIPRAWADRMVNVQRFTQMPEGGHFAALEVPELYADDLRAFFFSPASK
jgi:pimeloyl-ACP methyl ester carboxylesterase